MRYLSVCSGIEAATVAWRPLGWKAVGFSEIESVPNAVLSYHYPDVPNLGDMEKFNEWPASNFDVLVGGTPCQSFSIAGLRKGLADPRGNLTLGYLGVVAKFRPRWFVWENVPGAFSSVSHQAPDPCPPSDNVGLAFGAERTITDEYDANEVNAFACFLAGVSELGYGWAYRILDAQYFGVPQRRRRVFVVGHSSGAWQRAAAVLFERDSLFRNTAPSRETRQDITTTLASRAGGSGRPDGGDGQHSQLIDEVAGTIGSKEGGSRTTDLDGHGAYVPEIVPQAMSAKWHKGSSGFAGDEHHNLVTEPVGARPYADRGSDENLIAEAFKPSHYTRGKDGAPSDIHASLSADADKGDKDPVVYQCHGDNVGPLGTLRTGHNEISGVPFTFDETQVTHPENRSNPQPGDPATTVPSHGRPPTVAYSITPEAGQGADLNAVETDVEHALGVSRNERGTRLVATRVRRLTPLECERLQGFPDNYTDVPGASDSARYRALGNSMAVPVMAWIGRRLQQVEEIE